MAKRKVNRLFIETWKGFVVLASLIVFSGGAVYGQLISLPETGQNICYL